MGLSSSTPTLVFPEVATSYGVIKPEYRESYNHQMTPGEIAQLIQFLESGQLQEAINLGNVRKIHFEDVQVRNRFFAAVVESNNTFLYPYFTKKMSYDDLACAVLTYIREHAVTPEFRAANPLPYHYFAQAAEYGDLIRAIIQLIQIPTSMQSYIANTIQKYTDNDDYVEEFTSLLPKQ